MRRAGSAAVTSLPRTRQKRLKPAPANRREAQRALARAFVAFTEVAGALEKSYEGLQSEVGRLRAELERANSELAQSLEENSRVRLYLSRILEGLPCGVLALDASGTVRIINPEARRILMLARDWMPGSTDPVPASLEQFLANASSNQSSAIQEFTLAAPEGKIFIAVARTRLCDADETNAETILILRDITEDYRVASEREASRRVRALAELSTLLAHEIRNPLGSLELFGGLIADATVNLPDAQKWVEHLQAGLRGLSATVNNVLSFHSQASSALVPIKLARLLRDTSEFLRPVTRQRNMQISFISRIGEVTIAADPHRLQQVFFNLALNGFRAMSSGGVLTVRLDWAADAEGRMVQIDFEDRGTGIKPEHLPKLFEAGFSTNAGSPGLGLAVCKTVVEQHKGAITVRATSERGTTFSITLPIAGGQA